MTTADAVLSALERFNLKEVGDGKYRSSSPDRAADAKGMTRNALIVQMLTKATKTKKSREDGR